MLSNRKFIVVLFAVTIVVLLAGVGQLFRLRFAAGDVYPPYSSLRADPMGTKAFHDSLKELSGLKVERWYKESKDLPPGAGAGLFFFGLAQSDVRWIPSNEAEDLNQFMRDGGSMILTLKAVTNGRETPEDKARRERREKKEAEKESEEKSKSAPSGDQPKKDGDGDGKKKRSGEKKEKPVRVELSKLWGVQVVLSSLQEEPTGRWIPEDAQLQSGVVGALPLSLAWHSPLVFTNLTDDWKAVYKRGTDPVWIEKNIGKGKMVLISDSYPFSNEALQKHRDAAVLSHVIGASQRIYFDETHLGVGEDPGIASLIRRYRLEGVVFVFLLLGVLFIWRSVTSLVPPDMEIAGVEGNVVAGRDSGTGFVNLLRRGVPAGELLSVCLAEWRRYWGVGRGDREQKIAAVEAIIKSPPAGKGESPVVKYREISRLLRTKSGL
ncbi:MAG TPA: DUF4350 domain-containing protein [Roseimicrobium sp.]|nr:DUF4350 domain-containing protein [Roseimicrobium sp.]